MSQLPSDELGRLYQVHAAALMLFVRTYADTHQAADIVQEAFLKLLSQHRPVENVRAWLYRCVRNEALNRLRVRNRRGVHQRRLAQGRPDWFEPQLDHQLDARAAAEALESLEPAQREIVTMRIWGELTWREIAEVLEMPLSSAFHAYAGALNALKTKLEQPCNPSKTT